MTNRLFVISGCARSGLARTARVLTAMGAPCGHEDVFHPGAFTAGPTLFWPPRVAGDASWYAAPVLSKLPEGSVVVHQTRHPLATIFDLRDAAFFDTDAEARTFVQDFLPETRLGGSLVRSMRFWLEWNRMIEAAEDYEDIVYRRVQREALDAQAFVETAALFGVARSVGAAGRIVAEVEESQSSATLGWDDLPDGQLKNDVRCAAERYGYAA